MADSETHYTFSEWKAEGERRFGADRMRWRFVCPVCKHVASGADYRDAGAPEGAIAFSCIGRYLDNKSLEAFAGKQTGPCTYAGGGLFRLNPIRVTHATGRASELFAFAEAQP